MRILSFLLITIIILSFLIISMILSRTSRKASISTSSLLRTILSLFLSIISLSTAIRLLSAVTTISMICLISLSLKQLQIILKQKSILNQKMIL